MPTAALLDLPIEVQWQIASELPLASYMTLALHVCQSLRHRLTTHSSSATQRLLATRFSLVEWKQAAKDWRACHDGSVDEPTDEVIGERLPLCARPTSIWDTDSAGTPKPAAALHTDQARRRIVYRNRTLHGTQQSRSAALDSVLFAGNTEEAKTDVDFLVACLALVFGPESQPALPALAGRSSTASLRTLSMLSQKAVGLARLLDLLQRGRRGLADVETILITSAESTLWYDFAPPRHERAHAETVKDAVDEPNEDEIAPTCTETQAIAVPSVRAQRGHGLQVGFKCLCYGKRRGDRDDDDDTDTGAARDFHVILHDWYDTDEALGTEDMLANSKVECNWCGHDIVF